MSDDPKSFETRIQAMNRTWRGPEHTPDAAVFVHDTLQLAQLAAVDVFGPDVSPEIALAVFDRIDAERLRRSAEDAKARDDLAQRELSQT